MTKRQVFITKISVRDTLRSMSIGERRVFETKDIKHSSIRSAARALKAKGYLFEATEKGLVNEIAVMRLM